MSTMTMSPGQPGAAHAGPDLRPARRPRRAGLGAADPPRSPGGVHARAARRPVGLGAFLGARSVASERPGTPEPTRVVMVGSGDTLWQIAADLADDGDVRAMIDRIEELNALDTAMVTAGQRAPRSRSVD